LIDLTHSTQFFSMPLARQLNKVGQAISTLIWSDAVISLETFLLALMDRDDDPNAFNIIRYLVVHDVQLQARLGTFLRLGFLPDFWDEPDRFAKHTTYYAEHPLNPALGYNLPIYYSNDLLRFLPICDHLIGRLIETQKRELLLELVNLYHPLYAFHERPIGFVIDTLHYYYPVADGIVLAKLLPPTCVFNAPFRSFLETQDKSLIDSPQYVSDLVTRLALAIDTQNPFDGAKATFLNHTFRECTTESHVREMLPHHASRMRPVCV